MNQKVCQIPIPQEFVNRPEKTDVLSREVETSTVNTARFDLGLVPPRMQFFNRRRLKMLSRKKVINLFIKYYINEDRNNVRSLLINQSSSSDFSDDLCALETSKIVDLNLVAKKERDGSIDALQKRQSYVMKERIDAINERLKLGGHPLLTEKEAHLIRKNWPSIYQLVRESIEENAVSGTSTRFDPFNNAPEFLR